MPSPRRWKDWRFELGVEIRTSCPVNRIEAWGDHATGVLLADGSRVTNGAVLSNVDVAHTLTNLLPREAVDAGRLRRLTRRRAVESSGFILLLGVQGEHPQLAQHNIFFSSDYRREFDDIFRREAPPANPDDLRRGDLESR